MDNSYMLQLLHSYSLLHITQADYSKLWHTTPYMVSRFQETNEAW